MTTIIENIKKEIMSWPYVTSSRIDLGGLEFRINERELGHVHGDCLADLPFPMDVRNDLVNSVLCHIIYYLNRDGSAVGLKEKKIYLLL